VRVVEARGAADAAVAVGVAEGPADPDQRADLGGRKLDLADELIVRVADV